MKKLLIIVILIINIYANDFFDNNLRMARNGIVTAQYNMGVIYQQGLEGAKKDLNKAIYWYKKSAKQGFKDAQHNLAVFFSTQGKDKESYTYALKAARQGLIGSQLLVAKKYFRAEGTKEDWKKSFYWYKKAATQGNAFAQHLLGHYYQNEIGIKKDDKKAFYWYKKSAKQGYMNAQYSLGEFYISNNGVVKKDYKKAKELFLKAKKQGHRDAKFALQIVCRDKPSLCN